MNKYLIESRGSLKFNYKLVGDIRAFYLLFSFYYNHTV